MAVLRFARGAFEANPAGDPLPEPFTALRGPADGSDDFGVPVVASHIGSFDSADPSRGVRRTVRGLPRMHRLVNQDDHQDCGNFWCRSLARASGNPARTKGITNGSIRFRIHHTSDNRQVSGKIRGTYTSLTTPVLARCATKLRRGETGFFRTLWIARLCLGKSRPSCWSCPTSARYFGGVRPAIRTFGVLSSHSE